MKRMMKLLVLLVVMLNYACGSSGVTDPDAIRGTETGNPSEPGPFTEPNYGHDGPPVRGFTDMRSLAVITCVKIADLFADDPPDACVDALMASPTFALAFGVQAGEYATYQDLADAVLDYSVLPYADAGEQCALNIGSTLTSQIVIDGGYIGEDGSLDNLYLAIPQMPGGCMAMFTTIGASN